MLKFAVFYFYVLLFKGIFAQSIEITVQTPVIKSFLVPSNEITDQPPVLKGFFAQTNGLTLQTPVLKTSENSNQTQVLSIFDATRNTFERAKDLIAAIKSIVGDQINFVMLKIKEVVKGIPTKIWGMKQNVANFFKTVKNISSMCVLYTKQRMSNVIISAQQGIESCINSTVSNVENLRARIRNLVSLVSTSQTEITNRIVQCLQNSNLNPFLLFTCLISNIDPVRQQIMLVDTEIRNTITTAKDTAGQSTFRLAKCVMIAEKDALLQQTQLFTTAKTCIADGVNQ